MERTPTMKAVVFDRYGPPEVLHLADVAKPVPNCTCRPWGSLTSTTECAAVAASRRSAVPGSQEAFSNTADQQSSNRRPRLIANPAGSTLQVVRGIRPVDPQEPRNDDDIT